MKKNDFELDEIKKVLRQMSYEDIVQFSVYNHDHLFVEKYEELKENER